MASVIVSADPGLTVAPSRALSCVDVAALLRPPQERERQDELIRFLAERIGRFSCQIDDANREWDLQAVVAERVRQKQKQRRDEEPAPVFQSNHLRSPRYVIY